MLCNMLYVSSLFQVDNGIELDTVGRQFEPYTRAYRWRPCGETWDVVPEQ